MISFAVAKVNPTPFMLEYNFQPVVSQVFIIHQIGADIIAILVLVYTIRRETLEGEKFSESSKISLLAK